MWQLSQGLVALALSANQRAATVVEVLFIFMNNAVKWNVDFLTEIYLHFLTQLNSETDFVALNERFQTSLSQISDAILQHSLGSGVGSCRDSNGMVALSLEALKTAPLANGETVR